jgi:hypothetical protein
VIAAGTSCPLTFVFVVTHGHGWSQAAFPLAAAVIAGAFSIRLVARTLDKWRPHEAVWSVALAMYAVASFSMFLGVVGGWTTVEFLLYWLFGAVLNVPYLFAGEVYLLAARRTIGHVVLGAIVALSVAAAFLVLRADVCEPHLGTALPLGKDVFESGTPNLLAQLYAIPAYFLLLIGLAWSVWKMRRVPALRSRAFGVGEIAVGATIVAIGSGIGAAFHVVPLFSVSLALGVAVMFAGFLQTSAPQRATATPG